MSAVRRETVAASPSATVVILRESGNGPELLMVKRRAGDVFGDSYAFPGGLVDDDEPMAHKYCRGLSAAEADRILRVAGGGLDFYSAAARELFEETGILLARDASGRWAVQSPGLQALRAKVDKAVLPWSEFLRDRGLYIACEALHYFAHWETPLSQAKRWSARFFFAELPVDQEVSHDGGELTDSLWITATKALSAARVGDMKLPFPTIRNLRSFRDIDTVEGIIGWARQRASEGVRRIRPVRLETDGQWKWAIPGDPGYPDDEAHADR